MLPAAPTPVDSIKGNSPKIKANEVIRIGRKRAVAPLIAALTMLIPFLRLSTANSTIKIAFFANKPINMMSVIWVYILLSTPNILSKINTPAKPTGKEINTANGRI
ncbi:hypothetical protein D3C79_1009600 [compost metagenome]